ncbi:hypothetical protein FD09_GL001564 [Schleiferilactobacillus perolens DSM 12744]|uniref:Uncharacterized protein n=1 Tax=Schleiferilactobacillus perolens DSM 12744 TaxID=1423792 RepID=A0A0R1MLC6_9LACO|nr:hypothetical protein FD09_GL001564 [Schleiferilactobacillus perolens DSM 12744]
MKSDPAKIIAEQERLLDDEVEQLALRNIQHDDGRRMAAEQVIGHEIPGKIDPLTSGNKSSVIREHRFVLPNK